MTGAHRGPAKNPAVLMARATGVLALLALAGVGIYLATTDPAVALYVVAGLQAALLIVVFGDVAWRLLRKPPRSLVERVRLSTKVLLPVSGAMISLSVIGQLRGWLHDGTELAVAWTAVAFSIAVAVYRIVGERLLMAALTARAADDSHDPADL